MAYTGGFVGKIAIVDLTSGTVEEISSEKYQEYGGGMGLGTALFWDYCEDKTIDGFDPANFITLAAGAFTGTPVPSASGHSQVTGIGVYGYPKPWFQRSGFGGRWGAMLKAAGWDAIAVKGAASEPVWINVMNDKITIESAADLWGMRTHATQEEIWKRVQGKTSSTGWMNVDNKRDSGRTTQRPAVVCIGPAGENKSRLGVLVHDAGCVAGQGGFGGIFGAKNLKAISVIGTGDVPVADPAALVDIRMEMQEKFGYKVDEPTSLPSPAGPGFALWHILTRAPGHAGLLWNNAQYQEPSRPMGCTGCFVNCRHNFASGVGNGNHCVESIYWQASEDIDHQLGATMLLDELGINAFNYSDHVYLLSLYKMGVLGPGKEIESNLPWDNYASFEFVEKFLTAIAYREDIGADLAEGLPRAAAKWGRWEQDTATRMIDRPIWGYAEHYDPRLEVDWSYGAMFTGRDRNEHAFNWHVHWEPLICGAIGAEPPVSAKEMVNLLAETTGVGDPMGWDYSAEGIYSDARLKALSWCTQYSTFWLQSCGMCDWVWPQLIRYDNPDHKGAGFEYEARVWKAVTGEEMTREESLERGRKIHTMERAIFLLQGRERTDEVFTDYVYDVKTSAPYGLPAYIDGAWRFDDCLDRSLDRERVEDVKTRYYALQGWDEKSYPMKDTVSSMGLTDVASALEAQGKLGA